jgi:putative endopeptidase
MIVLCTTAYVAILAATILSAAAVPHAAHDLTQDDTDHSINPGNDFYQYANGAWLRSVVIPAGQSGYHTRVCE